MRAFSLLERVACADGPLSLRDATEGSGLPKPTVYRMLTMLANAGLVVRDADGRRLARMPLDVALAHLPALRSAADAIAHTF